MNTSNLYANLSSPDWKVRNKGALALQQTVPEDLQVDLLERIKTEVHPQTKKNLVRASCLFWSGNMILTYSEPIYARDIVKQRGLGWPAERLDEGQGRRRTSERSCCQRVEPA